MNRQAALARLERVLGARTAAYDGPLPYNYIPRPYQQAFWDAMDAGIKRAVLVWHRRGGKDKTCWNYMIKRAWERVGQYYYVFPDAKMARKILWDGIDKNGFKVVDHVPKGIVAGVNNSEMKIRLKNGSLILVLGSHDRDSLRGPNPVGVVLSEWSEQHPGVWDVLSPILRENEGWSIFNFTPKGQNHARDLYEMARSNPAWFAQLLTVEDTGAIPLEEIAKERSEGRLSEDMIQQEYYCSFTLGIEGSYYAKYLQDVRSEGRIGYVPYDKNTRVHTAWDLGYGDSTAIIFFQIIGQELHIIDFYESHGEGLAHYAKVLRDRPYIYGSHYAPHDVEGHHLATGLSTKEVGADLGLSFITLPTLRSRVEDGIESLRGIFPRLWFAESSTRSLVKCLENYRKEFDEMRNVYKLKPVHDWTSHAADAMRYMAMAVRLYVDKDKDVIDDRRADDLYDKYNPRFG